MDYFQLWVDAADTSTDTITDFTAGDGGNKLLIPTSRLTNLPAGTNPFVSGHVRLTQSGADTLVEVDLDGPGGAGAFQTMAILKNVTKGSLMASNLMAWIRASRRAMTSSTALRAMTTSTPWRATTRLTAWRATMAFPAGRATIAGRR